MIDIGLVVLEIQKAEFGNFTVPVNNTLVCRTTFVFLAADTLLCVLLYMYICILEVSDCDVLRLSQFLNITYHDCENNHDYKVVTVNDNKLMQQVTFDYIKCVYMLGEANNHR